MAIRRVKMTDRAWGAKPDAYVVGGGVDASVVGDRQSNKRIKEGQGGIYGAKDDGNTRDVLEVAPVR